MFAELSSMMSIFAKGHFLLRLQCAPDLGDEMLVADSGLLHYPNDFARRAAESRAVMRSK